MILIEFAAAPASIAAGLYIWARRNGSSLARAFAILFVTLGLAFLFDVGSIVFKFPSVKFTFYANRIMLVASLANVGRVFIDSRTVDHSVNE